MCKNSVRYLRFVAWRQGNFARNYIRSFDMAILVFDADFHARRLYNNLNLAVIGFLFFYS